MNSILLVCVRHLLEKDRMEKMMKKNKMLILQLLMASCLFSGLSITTVWGAKEVIQTKVPAGIISETMNTLPENHAVTTISDYHPEIRYGSYERWIDRMEHPDYSLDFYHALIEGSDGDGYEDFLVDENQTSLIETIKIYEEDAYGNARQVDAKGIKVVTITSVGTSWDEAYGKINELYYETYYTLRDAYEAFDRDCPEVFWLCGTFYVSIPEYKYYQQWNENTHSYEYYYTGDVYVILESPIFDMNYDSYLDVSAVKQRIENVNQWADRIIAGAEGKSVKEKITYFNNWLIMNNEYNYRVGKGNEPLMNVVKSYPDAFECTAALEGLTGNYGPVCESYARALKVLCDRSGIPCVLVDGLAINTVNGVGENHMWNYVEVDGAWYAVDATWNDPLYGNTGAVSGNECEDYLLIGANTYTAVGGGSMRFIDSHPVTNKLFTDSVGLVNGPVLSVDPYVEKIKNVTLTANTTSVTYGYTDLPILTANVETMSDQTGDMLYRWYEVDQNGNEVLLDTTNSNAWEFPDYFQTGTHTIRVKATMGQCTKSADIEIKVIRTSFRDVTEDAYYYNSVSWAVLNNITAGYYGDLFAPDMNCTRGQVVTFLWRANGCPEPETSENPFWDVASSDYYYKAVLWAVENGITAGYYEHLFAPDDTITRAQFVTFLYRAEGKPAYSTENPFSDVDENMYYHNAVLWAVENGITAGYYGDLFAPEIGCTRGQVVTFLYRNR